MILRFVLFLSMVWTVPVMADRIHAVGSSTVLPVIAKAADRYHREHPDVTITVSGGGSGVGVSALINDSADVGMSSREVTAKEASSLDGRVEKVVVARDAVAVVVSKPVIAGGVRALSLAQIAAIFRGEIHNWKEVGGPDAPILVIDKEAGRGTRHVFASTVLGAARARAPGAWIVAGSNNEMQSLVARSDNAIGILSNAWTTDKVQALAIKTERGEVAPTADNVVAGRYPIRRDLLLLVPVKAPPAVRKFIAFVLSPAGQELVTQTGYLPVR